MGGAPAGTEPLEERHALELGAAQTYLLCRVLDRWCAIPTAYVKEILRPQPIVQWDGALHCVRGSAILRGRSVPVISATALLSGSVNAAPENAVAARSQATNASSPAALQGLSNVPCFVRLELADRHAALLVDGVIGVRTFHAEQLQDVPPLLQPSVPEVERLLQLDGQLGVVLSAMKLFATLSDSAGSEAGQ